MGILGLQDRTRINVRPYRQIRIQPMNGDLIYNSTGAEYNLREYNSNNTGNAAVLWWYENHVIPCHLFVAVPAIAKKCVTAQQTHPTIAPPPTLLSYDLHLYNNSSRQDFDCYSFLHLNFFTLHTISTSTSTPTATATLKLAQAPSVRLLPRPKPIVNLIESR